MVVFRNTYVTVAWTLLHYPLQTIWYLPKTRPNYSGERRCYYHHGQETNLSFDPVLLPKTVFYTNILERLFQNKSCQFLWTRCTGIWRMGEFPPILSLLEARVRLLFSPCFPEETGPVECLPEHGVRHPEKNLRGRSGDWVIILTSSCMSTLIWVNQPYPGLRPQQLTQKIHVSSVLEFIRLGIPGY